MRMEELHIGSIFRHILSIHTIQVFPSPIINNATHGAQQATPVPVPTHYVPTACYCRSPIVSNYACTNIEDDFSHCLLPLGLERPSGGPNDNEVRKLEARRWQQSRTPRHTQEAPMSRTHICNVTSSGSAAGNPSCLGGGTLVLGWPASNKRWNKHFHTMHNVQVRSVGTQCTMHMQLNKRAWVFV